MKPTTTDTGHHLLEDEQKNIYCDCGWKPTTIGKGMQALEALDHHREVCAQIVRDQVWWSRLLKMVRGG